MGGVTQNLGESLLLLAAFFIALTSLIAVLVRLENAMADERATSSPTRQEIRPGI
jgi:hypothetical protein